MNLEHNTEKESYLIERLRVGKESSRELDALVAEYLGWRPHMPRRHQKNPRARYEQNSVNPGTYELWIGNQPCGKEKYVPKVTSSVDAAMMFCGEKNANEPHHIVHLATGMIARDYYLHMRFWEPETDGPYQNALARYICLALIRPTLVDEGGQYV